MSKKAKATQPTLELPEFEGVIPVGVLTTLTGASQRINRPIHHGDKLVLLVEAELVDVRHPKTKDGVKRKQVLSVVDFYELDGTKGKELLVAEREAYRVAEDERQGRAGLPFENPPPAEVGFLDENGHPLDEEDLAEIRGNREAVDELERGRGGSGEPWPGFEESGAREVIGHIRGLESADECVAVASWEEGHGGRVSVVQAARKRAAELGGGV